MPKILSIGTAVPPYVLKQSDVKQFAKDLYGAAYTDIERIIAVFDHAEISERHFCVPLEWFGTPKSFTEKNNLYIENAIALSSQSIEACLSQFQITLSEISYIIFVSSTGFSTPTIDARLIQSLPFSKSIKRVPLWGLGCAGGASGLSRAMEIAKADPKAKILLVATELCGLTFIHNDFSKSALISTSLFGDGSATVLIAGDSVTFAGTDRRPELVSSATETMPDSLNVMGWTFRENGLQVVLSKDIPEIVKTFMKASVKNFLTDIGLTLKDIDHYITHPGGAKVLKAYEESFDLQPDKLYHARTILRYNGNMSAPSVLFILQRFLDDLRNAHNQYGLVGALGPGFSAELLLLKW